MKKLVIVLLSTLMIFTVAGCGKTAKSSGGGGGGGGGGQTFVDLNTVVVTHNSQTLWSDAESKNGTTATGQLISHAGEGLLITRNGTTINISYADEVDPYKLPFYVLGNKNIAAEYLHADGNYAIVTYGGVMDRSMYGNKVGINFSAPGYDTKYTMITATTNPEAATIINFGGREFKIYFDDDFELTPPPVTLEAAYAWTDEDDTPPVFSTDDNEIKVGDNPVLGLKVTKATGFAADPLIGRLPAIAVGDNPEEADGRDIPNEIFTNNFNNNDLQNPSLADTSEAGMATAIGGIHPIAAGSFYVGASYEAQEDAGIYTKTIDLYAYTNDPGSPEFLYLGSQEIEFEIIE